MIALIPLRSGSKGIPMKNIKEMAGKPLCAWVIKAALESNIFDDVIVSTDSTKIANIANYYGADVIMRPAEFATDEAATESVMLHVAGLVPFKTIVTIQATSPLTTADDLRKAYNKYVTEDLDSLFSGTRVKKFFWTDDIKPLNYDPQQRPMRQQWDGTICENGAFYFTSREVLEKHKCRLGGKIGVYIMPVSIDIDDMEDWAKAEKYLREGHYAVRNMR